MCNVTHGFDSRESSPPATRTYGDGKHTSGAMEELLQKVQHASTHILRRQNHEHAHSSRSIQGSVQGGKWRKRAEDEHTHAAVLLWILQPSKLATPLE